MTLDQLTDAVWQRLQQEKPRALLIGECPENLQKYIYVNEKPYEAVVIGELTPEELFRMPTDPVCRALFDGLPVYLSDQPCCAGRTAPELRRELQGAVRRLLRLGAVGYCTQKRLITAAQARYMVKTGEKPPADSRMTPLARDILEGKDV